MLHGFVVFLAGVRFDVASHMFWFICVFCSGERSFGISCGL